MMCESRIIANRFCVFINRNTDIPVCFSRGTDKNVYVTYPFKE